MDKSKWLFGGLGLVVSIIGVYITYRYYQQNLANQANAAANAASAQTSGATLGYLPSSSGYVDSTGDYTSADATSTAAVSDTSSGTSATTDSSALDAQDQALSDSIADNYAVSTQANLVSGLSSLLTAGQNLQAGRNAGSVAINTSQSVDTEDPTTGGGAGHANIVSQYSASTSGNISYAPPPPAAPVPAPIIIQQAAPAPVVRPPPPPPPVIEESGGGGGCYLTTLLVEHEGLPDNCRELTTLRRFRDGVMLPDPKLRPLVDEYYARAPAIVARIKTLAPKRQDRVYAMIRVFVDRAIQCARNDDTAGAIEWYQTMVEYADLVTDEA